MMNQRPMGGGPVSLMPKGSGLPEQAGEGECRGRLIGASPQMTALRAMVGRIACFESPVLISGEPGSGRRAVAEAVHFSGPRASGPLVFHPCHVSDSLEEELFAERLPCAVGGTLVLEEVDTLPASAQVRLACYLREKTKPGVRVMATTTTPLEFALGRGEFRPDLYYLLNVIPLEVPPLRERLSDLPLLVEEWAAAFCRRGGLSVQGVTAGGMEVLRRYSWPGNLRELEGVLERAAVMTETGRPLEANDFAFLREESRSTTPPRMESAEGGPMQTLEELEREHVLRTLEYTRQNRTRAAGLLKISVRTLRNKLHQYRDQGFLVAEAPMPSAE